VEIARGGTAAASSLGTDRALRARPALWRSPLERDDFSLNRPPALASCLSLILSENRYPLFGIML